jgi:hypothetical protein
VTRPGLVLVAAASLLGISAATAEPFQGQIEAVVTRGEQSTRLLYTIGPETVRVEVVDPKTPAPVDLLDLKSGTLTLLFPHNHSFMRMKSGRVDKTSAPAPGFPMRPSLPGAAAAPAIPPMPRMPAPGQQVEALKATGRKERILGFDCAQYEISERGETIAVWATVELVPFQNYRRDASPHYGPRLLEEEWAEQLAEEKIFPLRAVLHDETPNERFRFEVKSIRPAKVEKAEEKEKLFRPPADYSEIQPASPSGR